MRSLPSRATMMLTCSRCKTEKSENEFTPSKQNKRGKDSWCYVCKRASSKRWQQNGGAEVQRAYHLKRKYNISLEEYDAILAAQNHSCAICGTRTPAGVGRFHVDHDHATKRVRGLLCHGCNRGIGYLRDDIFLLAEAIKYISSRK